MFISKMEGNLEKYSISEWRKKKREKREKKNASKKNTTWKIEKCLLKRHDKK